MTKDLARDGRKRGAGAPEDEARNWALIRLMWVWRDVLGEEPRIYVQKIRDRAELDEPEPQGCMAFIVAVRGDRSRRALAYPGPGAAASQSEVSIGAGN